MTLAHLVEQFSFECRKFKRQSNYSDQSQQTWIAQWTNQNSMQLHAASAKLEKYLRVSHDWFWFQKVARILPNKKERSKAKPKQTRVLFDSQLKTALFTSSVYNVSFPIYSSSIILSCVAETVWITIPQPGSSAEVTWPRWRLPGLCWPEVVIGVRWRLPVNTVSKCQSMSLTMVFLRIWDFLFYIFLSPRFILTLMTKVSIYIVGCWPLKIWICDKAYCVSRLRLLSAPVMHSLCFCCLTHSGLILFVLQAWRLFWPSSSGSSAPTAAPHLT